MDIRSIFVVSIFLLFPVHWQVLGNRGREFVFGLMEAYAAGYNMYFVATSDQPANITVSSPHIQMNTTYKTTGGFLSVNLSRALYHEEANQKSGKGISVKADVDISLYVMSDMYAGCETFMVLPVTELGNRYIVGMYSSRFPGVDDSEILIVCRYNNTRINITLRAKGSVLLNGVNYSNGHVYSLEMSEFETFLLQSTKDLTGTEIQSNNPLAVLSGNICTFGKYGKYCDHVVEQIPPVNSLGTDFIALFFKSSEVNFTTLIRAVSVDENTEVYIQGRIKYVLKAGEYAEHVFYNSISIRTSKPLLVLEMAEMKPLGTINVDGDPFMIVLPSFSQFSTNYIFSLPTSASTLNNLTEHHIVVTIESVYQRGILLDGSNIEATYTDKVTGPDGLTNFSVLIYKVSIPGRHNLRHTSSDVKFGAVLYGEGEVTSYGHPLGIRINNTDVNECLSSPCEHGGKCTNTNGTYTCDCPFGWEGKNCLIDVNECQELPCKNGGNCTNTKGSYLCNCPTVWQGQNCSMEVPQLSTTSEISTQSGRQVDLSGTPGSTEQLKVLHAVIGSLAGLLVISVLLIFWFIRKNRRNKKEMKKELQYAKLKTTEDDIREYDNTPAMINTELNNIPEVFCTISSGHESNQSRRVEQGYSTLTILE